VDRYQKEVEVMNEDLESLVEPQPEDTMENHAEQHSAMTRLQREISKRVKDGETLQATIEERVSNHDHDGYAAADHTHPGGGGDAGPHEHEDLDFRIKALETPPIGHAHYRHGVYTNPGFAQITQGSPGNFAINRLDALGNKFIAPEEGDTFTYKLNDVEQSFEVTFVASTATQSVMQGEITTASKDGDIIDVAVEEVGFPEHDHPELMTKSGSQFIETPWKVKEESSTYIAIEDGEQGIYHVATPTASHHAANMAYVDENDVDPEQWEPTFGMAHTYDYTINSHYPNDFGWEYAKYRVHGNSPVYVNLQTGSHGTSDNFDLEWKFETNGSKMNWHFPADTEGYPTMKIANASVEINGKLKINGQQVDPASIVFDMSEQQRKIEELTQMVNELKAKLDGREND
jgi:hypothetical protein